MEFHFIKLNYNGTYLSLVDPKSKSRFVCFAEKDIAIKCLEYSADFRARNRIWPSLDMSSENRKLQLNDAIEYPYGPPRIIKRSLEIETFDFNTLDKISSRTNVSFYCILAFDVIFNSIKFFCQFYIFNFRFRYQVFKNFFSWSFTNYFDFQFILIINFF